LDETERAHLLGALHELTTMVAGVLQLVREIADANEDGHRLTASRRFVNQVVRHPAL
jgi:hypothetical protein